MNDAVAPASIPADGLRRLWNRIADALSSLIKHASLALVDHIAIGAIFVHISSAAAQTRSGPVSLDHAIGVN